ncbi:MAG: tetratricopeptide repeat protein [Caldithrix sp.]|nr:tetratricopeptide repeat protein [Caldithrix sp.]
MFSKHLIKIVIIFSVMALAGCAYFNTFFNARKNYNLAEEELKKHQATEKVPSNVKNYYEKAIEKSWKVINVYSDSNKWADDALLLIGKSHYNLQEYGKAERVFDQFLLKYRSSPFVPQAKLWLAKSKIALQKDDEALNILDNLFEGKVKKRTASNAFFIRGDLNYKRSNYEKAIENFEKAIKLTSDDRLEGDAFFLIGKSFMALKEYENAIFNFEKLEKMDVPPLKEFEAIVEKVNALIELNEFERAETNLNTMLNQQRFKDQFALIETKLGNLYEAQDQTELAAERYRYVINEYPRSEGEALSAFYLAQLFEFEYGQFDSAKVYYNKARKQRSRETLAQDASERLKLVDEYLKIRNDLNKDYRDMQKLLAGDSSLVDSVEVEIPEEEPFDENVSQRSRKSDQNSADTWEQLAQDDQSPPSDDENIQPNERGQSNDPANVMNPAEQGQIEGQTDNTGRKNKPEKIAVSRRPEEVEQSMLKNSFALGEFFLLKYENYDSAAVSYKRFINNFQDSLLTPKAYYALYYIYHNVKHDTVVADSLKSIIIKQYPETTYARKLRDKTKHPEPITKKQEIDASEPYHDKFLKAEDLKEQKRYNEAIEIFNEIAQNDSGSIWAKKSRYVTAYIYEHYLQDIEKAIQTYTLLQKEYPKTEFGQIASSKIKAPEPEKEQSEQPGTGEDQELKEELNQEEERQAPEISGENDTIRKEPSKREREESDRPK